MKNDREEKEEERNEKLQEKMGENVTKRNWLKTVSGKGWKEKHERE